MQDGTQDLAINDHKRGAHVYGARRLEWLTAAQRNYTAAYKVVTAIHRDAPPMRCAKKPLRTQSTTVVDALFCGFHHALFTRATVTAYVHSPSAHPRAVDHRLETRRPCAV